MWGHILAVSKKESNSDVFVICDVHALYLNVLPGVLKGFTMLYTILYMTDNSELSFVILVNISSPCFCLAAMRFLFVNRFIDYGSNFDSILASKGRNNAKQ